MTEKKYKNVFERKIWNGFTLVELMIYSGILVGVGFIGTSVFLSVSRTYLKNQTRAEVTQNLRVAVQFIQQSVQQASRVNQATGSLLELQMPSGATTTFTLQAGTIYRQDAGGPQVAITSNKVDVTSLSFLLVTTFQTRVDSVNRWAWNGGAGPLGDGIAEGLGWLDFNPSLGHVRVPLGAGELFGYAYFPSIDGYVSLNCVTTNSCASVDYRVASDASGTLSGWAWNDTYGWISFNGADPVPPATTTSYSVVINTSTGEFTGWAWSENLGWISFNCANPQVNSCGTVNYKVTAPKRFGRPVSGVQTSMTVGYRDGGNVLLRYSDSFTTTIVLAQPSDVIVSSIAPATVVQGTTVSGMSVSGVGFRQEGLSNPTVRLTRSGFNDVFPTVAFNYSSSVSLTGGEFNFTGVAVGQWNVVVTNPDGQQGVCVACLTVNP